MNPGRPADKRVRTLLSDLESRARRGPGLYPVREPEDFFRLAALHLGLPAGPLDRLAELEQPVLEDLASALDTLVRCPAEASVWANRILLRSGAQALAGIPRNARREQAREPVEHLASLLRGAGEKTRSAHAAA